MPTPGWLRVGLLLQDKKLKRPFRVTAVGRTFFEAHELFPGECKIRLLITCIRYEFQALDYYECDDCRKNPGAPTLCSECLERRRQHGIRRVCDLPRFCKKSYKGGYVRVYTEDGDIPKPTPPKIPSRYERTRLKRNWVI